MLNIYNLTNEVVQLRNTLLETADEDGVVDEKLYEYFNARKGDLATACTEFGAMIKSVDAYVQAVANEIARLEGIKSKLEKRQERAKERLKLAMNEAGTKKLESVNVQIRLGESQRTIIDDKEQIPMEFKSVVQTIEEKIDKTAIKKAINEGHEVAGSHVETCINITIK